MRRAVRIPAFISLGIVMLSCMKSYNYTSVPVAGLTMVNGFSDEQSIVYYINERLIVPLNYKNFSLIPLITGKRNFIIRSAESEEIIVDTTFYIEDNMHYTSFTFASLDKPSHFITIDKTIPESSGAVGVRFFNLATTDGRVSLQIDNKTSQTQFKNRALENQTSAREHQAFVPQSSGLVNLTIKDSIGNTLARKQSVMLDTAQYYSIILVGKEKDSKTPLQIDVIEQTVD